MATSSLFTLLSIGLIQLLAVISPGPSFLITARTAVAQSRLDGIKVALGLGAGTVIWSTAALLGLNAVFHADAFHVQGPLTEYAKKVGADCHLQVVPYYNRPTQEGMYHHFKKVAETVDLPMVLYNVPGRTVADMQHETVLRLAQVPGILGIKEATGNIERAQWLIRDVPQGFAVLSGDDPTAVALMLCGGQGNISVTANIAPRLMHELCVAAMAGNAAQAMQIQKKLMPVHKHLFVEPNPVPLKWAMARMGLCGGTLRLPLWPLSAAQQPVVENALRASGLL